VLEDDVNRTTSDEEYGDQIIWLERYAGNYSRRLENSREY